MIVRLGRRFGSWAVFGGHGVIFFIAMQAEDVVAFQIAFFLMGGISFFAWIGAYRRWRAIGGTPTSRVASAAQGYVELVGLAAEPPGGTMLQEPATGESCRWYRFDTREKRRDSKGKEYWTTVKEGQSDLPFGLRDDTGVCSIRPVDAEMLVAETKRVREGSSREHILWLIRDGDPLYALGHFETTIPAATVSEPLSDSTLDAGADALLETWKKDETKMLALFDRDRDGRVDDAELAVARKLARQFAANGSPPKPAGGGVHRLRAPDDGALFLIADRGPDDIAGTYRLLAWGHLAFFFGGLVAAYFLFFSGSAAGV